MTSEEQIILAFIFKRSGKKSLKESEIYLPLSLELKWFSTKEAREFVTHCIDQNFVSKNDDMLTPIFSVEEIQIPIGFVPTKKNVIKEKKLKIQKKSVEGIIEKISRQVLCDSQKIYDEVFEVAREKKILEEVAVLLVARKYAVPVDEFINEIQKILFKENIG